MKKIQKSSKKMSKKFGRKTLTQVNLPGRGNKTKNPKNENKKTKNIYKMLVEKGDDQEKPQKNIKTKPNPKNKMSKNLLTKQRNKKQTKSTTSRKSKSKK